MIQQYLERIEELRDAGQLNEALAQLEELNTKLANTQVEPKKEAL